MLLAVAITAGSVLALLACSLFQLYSSRNEIQGKRLDRRQLWLILLVLFCMPCVFLPPALSAFAPAYIFAAGIIMPFGGVVPFFVGSWVALRKGPVRVTLPLACLILVVVAGFEFFTFWLWFGATRRW
jgi:hypothetical protein